jgi:hypothetical protein
MVQQEIPIWTAKAHARHVAAARKSSGASITRCWSSPALDDCPVEVKFTMATLGDMAISIEAGGQACDMRGEAARSVGAPTAVGLEDALHRPQAGPYRRGQHRSGPMSGFSRLRSSRYFSVRARLAISR